MIVVDRIEDGFAVVYSGNELDEAAEQERRRAISEKMRRLFK